MTQKKYTIVSVLFLIVMAVSLLFSLGITFAWFTDKESAGPQTLSFGNVKIDLSDDNKGALTPASVVPGGNIFAQSVKFNLNSSSDACYVRAKYAVNDNTAGGGLVV